MKKSFKFFKNEKFFKGQALGEFIIVTPLLMLVLMGAFFVGLAMYSGSQAATSMKEPILKRMTLAGNPNAVSAQSLNALVGQSPIGTLPAQLGQNVDQVVLKSPNDVMAVMVGKKSFNPGVPFIPVFNFSVAQAIDGNLLKANVAPKLSLLWSPPALTPVSPSTYGYTVPSIPNLQNLGSVSCASTATFSAAMANQLISGNYTLTAFSAPQTPPSGSPAFSSTYTAPLYVSEAALIAFTQAPHASCDGSVTKFQNECSSQLAPRYPLTDASGNPVSVQLDPVTNLPVYTDPVTGATIPPPTGLTDPTTGVPLQITPDPTTGQLAIVDPATGLAVPPLTSPTASDPAVCAQKKLAACKLQYASLYIQAQVKALSDNNACTTPTSASGTQFPAGSTYAY